MGLAFRTFVRILSSLGLLLVLGFTSLRDALDLWSFGAGSITIFDVFKTATIGAINEGFRKSFEYFPNLLTNIFQGNAGILILDLFMISILYAFIFCWVLIITDLITGEDKPPVKLTFIITSILFIIGTLIVGIFNPATPELIYHATNDTLNSTNMTEVWV